MFAAILLLREATQDYNNKQFLIIRTLLVDIILIILSFRIMSTNFSVEHQFNMNKYLFICIFYYFTNYITYLLETMFDLFCF